MNMKPVKSMRLMLCSFTDYTQFMVLEKIPYV